jgi:hypothetical protein
MKEAIEIINEHVYLQKAFKYLISNSSSNGLPYHNLNHGMTVLKYVYGGVKYHSITDEDEVKAILIAALCHDADHSGGKLKDNFNVIKAKTYIRMFSEYYQLDVDFDITDEMLDATEYPYKIERKDLSLRQAIIRDADLMQVYEDNWIHQIIYGLSEELNMDFFDLIELQIKFLESSETNTEWGKDMKAERWDKIILNHQFLKNIKDV